MNSSQTKFVLLALLAALLASTANGFSLAGRVLAEENSLNIPDVEYLIKRIREQDANVQAIKSRVETLSNTVDDQFYMAEVYADKLAKEAHSNGVLDKKVDFGKQIKESLTNQ